MAAKKKPVAQKKVKTTASRSTMVAHHAKKTPVAAKPAAVKKPAALDLKTNPVAEKQTKAEIFSDLSLATGLEKREVRMVFEALRNQIIRHLKTRGSGEFSIPEVGVKVRRVSKKATKARQGVNPFTGEPMTIKAKPARKSVRAVALKALKACAE